MLEHGTLGAIWTLAQVDWVRVIDLDGEGQV